MTFPGFSAPVFDVIIRYASLLSGYASLSNSSFPLCRVWYKVASNTELSPNLGSFEHQKLEKLSQYYI